ncbi:MAG: hypothetical protein CRN43_02145, partial [Candidatus Nephrothrix sp. EaCA]
MDKQNLQKMKPPTQLSPKKTHWHACSNIGTPWQGKNGEGTGLILNFFYLVINFSFYFFLFY